MKGLADRFFAWEAEDLPTKQELVDNCLKQLRKALQHRELVGKRSRFTGFNFKLKVKL